MKKNLSLLFIIFCLFCSNVSKAEIGDFGEIELKPYLGIGYSLSGVQNAKYGGIDYNLILPSVFNSFGGALGLRTKYLMTEFSVYGAIPSVSTSNNGQQYGISGATMDMVTMRFTLMGVLNFPAIGEKNNILLILGMVHASSNINYSISNPSSTIGLQYSGFGTNIEIGIGYMRDITEHFAIRTDFRYSPISISGMTSFLMTWNITFLGFL